MKKLFLETYKTAEEIKMKRKGSKENVLRFAGVLKDSDTDWDEKEKRMKKFRASFNKRLSSRVNKKSKN